MAISIISIVRPWVAQSVHWSNRLRSNKAALAVVQVDKATAYLQANLLSPSLTLGWLSNPANIRCRVHQEEGGIHPLNLHVSSSPLQGWRLDQVISTFAPLTMGQVMAWASHVTGCGFILGWNLVSLLVQFLFLSSLSASSPIGCKTPTPYSGCFLERQREAVHIRGNANSEELLFFLLLLC